jgi:predicted adenylyl cyclase CyaB
VVPVDCTDAEKERASAMLENENASSLLLVESKARVDGLEKVRKVIESMATKRIGILKQTDTYFKTRKGRLKLREIKGSNESALIYYERKDTTKPKRSDVFMVPFRKPMAIPIKRILQKALGTKVVVSKVREVYYYQGVRIHLDSVESLGTFIEFEKKVSANQIRGARIDLKKLLHKLGIDEEKLEKSSYSDMAFQRV